MNVPNTLQEKIFEFFNKLPLSGAERQAAQDYLSGKAGHEVLNAFSFEDLSAVPADPAIRLFRELISAKERETAAKLFSVLLAKGDSTCFRMIPIQIIDPEKGAVDIGTDSAKKAAVYAEILGTETYPLGSYSRDRLVDIACGKAETLKQALNFQKSKSENGRFVLYAVYFMRKYKCGDGKEKPVEAEDMPLLARYEEIAIECFDHLFPSYHPAIPEIKDAVREGKVTKQILELAGAKRGISRQTLRLLASMAYLNYPLSGKLRDVVKICLAAEMEEALDAINLIGLVTPMDIYTRGGAYDKEFDMQSAGYIRWAAKKGHTLILEKQFADNPEEYIRAMDDADLDEANKMFDIIKRKNPALYDELLEKKRQCGNSKEIEKLLNKLIRNNANAEVVKAYLRGETAVDTLYPVADKLGNNNYYIGHELQVLEGYDRERLNEAFYRRFLTYMWLRRGMWFLRSDIVASPKANTQISVEKVRRLFGALESEGLPVARQLSGISLLESYLWALDKETFHTTVVEIFARYLNDKREETLAAFAGGDVQERLLALEVLSRDAQGNQKEILAYVEDGAKKVRQALLEVLCRQTGWAEEVKGFLASKKAAVRELAVRVLFFWQKSGADYHELLAQVLQKEKNVKIREFLIEALNIQEDGMQEDKPLLRGDLVKEIHKGGKKRSLAWAYETPFSRVHTMAGEEAGEEYLQAILLCYSSMEKGGYNKNAEFLAKELHAGEFAVYVNELFDKWLAAGAEAKRRWVLYAASIHGGNEIIVKLMRQIKEWPKESRGAIACEAVRAMSLSPLPQGLLTVDGIARKFKHRQVRAAANEALDFAAEQLGIRREELEDRIIPDFGFDEELGRTFDYGERKFRVMITAALEIEVFEEIVGKETAAAKGAKKDKTEKETLESPEESAGAAQAAAKHVLGKKLKNLPAPGKKDDEKMAAAAYEEFKQMKKQIKTVASGQKLRLEQALSSARLWSIDSWKRLFVKNPVMHQFAIGLVWGIYEDGKLAQSFRYMEDGSFNTKDEEEYFLPEGGAENEAGHAPSKDRQADSGRVLLRDAKIGLVHPIELTKEELKAWKQQLEDYEITQPFPQLEREIFTVAEGELTQRKFSRFSGRVVNDMRLGSKLTEFGWYHGPVLDGGCVKTYYREDAEIGLGAELHFSGCFVGYLNEDITVYSVRFYKVGEAEAGCCLYEEDKSKACLLRDVPAKYFSEVVMQVEKASSKV